MRTSLGCAKERLFGKLLLFLCFEIVLPYECSLFIPSGYSRLHDKVFILVFLLFPPYSLPPLCHLVTNYFFFLHSIFPLSLSRQSRSRHDWSNDNLPLYSIPLFHLFSFSFEAALFLCVFLSFLGARCFLICFSGCASIESKTGTFLSFPNPLMSKGIRVSDILSFFSPTSFSLPSQSSLEDCFSPFPFSLSLIELRSVNLADAGNFFPIFSVLVPG